jgi:hypothetical protein
VALTILGFGLIVLLPFLDTRAPGTELAVATAELRAVLQSARLEAIAEGRDVTFRDAEGGYELDGRRYRFRSSSGAEAAPGLELVGNAQITFFPSGGSSGGRIVLTGTRRRNEIEIEAITGRAVLLPETRF